MRSCRSRAFDGLHFARFVIVDDATEDDLRRYGLPRPVPPLYLVFLGDCDGPGRAQLEAFARDAHDGLCRVFAHCVGFDPADLLGWLRRA